MSTINSEDYWDKRFIEDWDNKHGDQQSIFFMNLTIERFPEWFKRELGRGSNTVCDWGCAEGDGTRVFAETFPNCKVEGIDFATKAIESANKRYKRSNLSFISKDILKKKHEKKYNIVLASNIFEHFHDPWKVFGKISQYAKDYFIMIIPFNEDRENLMSEHFHGFRTDEFKPKMDKWQIVHFEVVDTSLITGTYWGGQQAIIIFASEKIVKNLSITFNDITLTADKTLDIQRLTQELDNCQQAYKSQSEELNEVKLQVDAFAQSRRYRIANNAAKGINSLFPPKSARRRAGGTLLLPVRMANKRSAIRKKK